MQKVKLSILLMVILILSSCNINKKEEYINILYDVEMNSSINIEEYKKVIEEILTYRDFDDTAKLLIREKYEKVVAPNVFNQLDTITNNTKLIYPGATTNTINIKINGEYPIYDDTFTIIKYGTYDEYIKSIEEFNQYNLNYIENIEASNDKIIVKIKNKYNGIFYLYVTLSNGMIIYINLLR